MSLKNCQMSYNSVEQFGNFFSASCGGIISATVTMSISVSDSTFTGNEVAQSGTVFELLGSNNNINLQNCVFTSNYASVYGGVVYVQTSAVNTLAATNCSFTANIAQPGGDVFMLYSTAVTLSLVSVDGSLNRQSRAIMLISGTLIAENSKFIRCISNSSRGGVFRLSKVDSTISWSNFSLCTGSCIYATNSESSLTLSDS